MARGVQGMMDLTVPAGGSSPSNSVGAIGDATDPRRDLGSIKRILGKNEANERNNDKAGVTHLWYKL